LRLDNGKENAKLGEVFPKDKIFNCDTYSSWQKGVIENVHRLIRRLWPKGISMNSLTNTAVKTIENFVNNYHRKRYNEYANYRYSLSSTI
jgi:IS30 family transposase